MRILSKAKSKELKIIAFTDHNSINGYKNILKIKEKLLNERNSLSLITDSTQTETRLAAIEKDLSLFDDILILPGVEFEVRVGIHLLIIFNNTVPLEKIDKFLLDGGYGPDSFGEEEPSSLSNWDIFSLYEETKNRLYCH